MIEYLLLRRMSVLLALNGPAALVGKGLLVEAKRKWRRRGSF